MCVIVLCSDCLDGSLPAYHLHSGSAAGASNWLLQFEVGNTRYTVLQLPQIANIKSLPRLQPSNSKECKFTVRANICNFFSMFISHFACIANEGDL